MTEENKPRHHNNGAFELDSKGKLGKNNKKRNLEGQRSSSEKELKKESWRVHLEAQQLNENIDAFLHQRDPKNVSKEFFEAKKCNYCEKELKLGNTSGFCNKNCMISSRESK